MRRILSLGLLVLLLLSIAVITASARAQYLDSDGTYKWTSTVTSKGNDVGMRAFVVTSPGGNKVYYVDASFRARCGSGSMKYYSDYASRK